MRFRPIVVVVVLAIVGAGCSWSQWGAGPEHRGMNLAAGLTTANVGSWVVDKVTDLPASSQVASANGLGFVEQDGRLVAFDTTSRAVVWSATLPSGTTAGGAPAVYAAGAASTVFVTVAGASGPVLLGFDVDGIRGCNPVLFTCSPVFSATLGSALSGPTPPVIAGSTVFANGADSLYAFDAKAQANCVVALGTSTCTPLWSASTGSSREGVGPAATTNGVIYDPGTAGAAPVVRAFAMGSGALLWTGSLPAAASATPSIGLDGKVFAPTGAVVSVFGGNGCGTPTCSPLFSLAKRTGDPAGSFLATPAFDGSSVFSTNANGTLSTWPGAGCGAASCQPTAVQVVNAPVGGSSGYGQSPVISSGILFVLTQQNVSGTNHAEVLALDESNGNELHRWDLGAGGFGTGLANVSMAGGVLYAPVTGALFAVHPKAVEPLASLTTSPLTLSPAFAPSIFDYVVRCATGTNSLTLTMSAVPGGTVALAGPTVTAPSPAQTTTVSLTPNQAAVVQATDGAGAGARYWIRCLPPDFPNISVNAHTDVGVPTPGWYLIGNNITSTGTQYSMILDTRGTPVWYRKGNPGVLNFTPVARNTVAWIPNVTGQAYNTNPDGRYDVLSLSTNTVSSITGVGVPVDLHELQMLPNGDHLVLSYPLKRGVDLTGLPFTPAPGPNSTIADCVVQQVNPQGQLVWQWAASDHVDPVTESTNPAANTVGTETVYDVYHCNSIDPNPSGNLLVSARNMSAVFEIRRSDGVVLWKMGGTATNKDGAAIIQVQNDPQGTFLLQHDARYMPNGHISLFDNQKTASARGIEYALDFNAKTAQPVFSYVGPDNLASCCMGTFRRYPDGHSIIGWGFSIATSRAVTELDPAGHSVLDLVFGSGNASYRAVKVPPPYFNLDSLRATAGQ